MRAALALPLAVLAVLGFAPAADAAILKFDTQQRKISYEGAPGEMNDVALTQQGLTVTIADAGATIQVQKNSACTSVSPSQAACTLPDAGYVVKVTAGDLADRITSSATIAGQLDGGAGDDVITGGDGDDKLLGMDGNDVLDGRGGNDAYDGGAGDDQIRARDAVGESVICGFGADGGASDPEDTLARDCENVVAGLAGLAAPALDGGGSGGGTFVTTDTTGTVPGDLSGDGTVDNEDLVTASPESLAQVPAPQPGATVGAAPGSGTVLVRRPGSKAFVLLDPGKSVPVGSVVDARRGSVTVVAAKNLSGDKQQATFTGGLFRVSQTRAAKGMTTVLTVRGTLACGRTTARAAAARKRPRSRRLWGDGRGRFTTRGRNSTATVRGTIWGVTDRCGGTLTEVKRGVVAVKDFRTKKTRLVRAGGRYLARNRT